MPIFLGGTPGEVYSAEVENGSTQLLLSIPCTQALDMIVFMRRQEVVIEELQVTVPMVTAQTKHVAVEVAFDPEIDRKQRRERPILKGDDIMVY